MSNVSDKRMEIIHSCIKVFAEKGYHKSTIGDIANEAGVGKGTVYLYFTGKDELFEEMLNYIFCKYYNKIKFILSQNESIESRIRNLIKFYRENIKERIEFIQTVMSEYNPMSSNKVEIIFKQKKAELNYVLSDFMKDGIERGEIRESIDKHIASISIFSTIEHYYLDKVHEEELEIDEETDDDLVMFILNMIK